MRSYDVACAGYTAQNTYREKDWLGFESKLPDKVAIN